MPKPDGNKPEAGSSPQHPIVVEGVAASDFVSLLNVLYASYFSSNRPTDKASLIVPAFRLACVFNFSDLRAHLQLLAEETLGDVDNILFTRKFNIKEWLAPAYICLCQQQQPVTAKVARKLRVESFILLWHMREKRWNQASPFVVGEYYCDSCIVLIYMRGDKECGGCRDKFSEAHQRYDYPGRMAGADATAINVEIEADVKRWVENGSVFLE